MKLETILKKKQSNILKKWFELTINTYPMDTAKFLKKEADPFANPVGNTINKTLNDLFEQLLKGFDKKAFVTILEPLIRIRAVQEFSPANATSFLFSLKQAIRVNTLHTINQEQLIDAYLTFENQIDEVCLIAFDIYITCREKVFQYKANHVKDRTLRLLKKANIISEVPDMSENLAGSSD